MNSQETSARILSLASEAGHILLENGAEISRVEDTMERIATHFGEQNENFFVLSNGIFSLWICANYFPDIITADSYRKDLIDGGYSAEYCDNLFGAINYKTIAVLLILCFVFGCIGALIGKAAIKKHFEKAGIV